MQLHIVQKARCKTRRKTVLKRTVFALLALKQHTLLHIRQRGEIHVVESRDYPEFCVTAKMRCKIELIFQGGSGAGCIRLVYNITPTGAEVKGHPRPLEPHRRYSAS